MACNYDEQANFDSGACLYNGACDEETPGCTYPEAQNFDPDATVDDLSCEFVGPCDDLKADLNGDGQVTSLDLLDFLSDFGAVCDFILGGQ